MSSKESSTDGKNIGPMEGHPFVCLAITGFLAGIVFFPCLGNSLTNWDDPFFIDGNPAIRNFSFNSIKEIFMSRVVETYCPMVMLGFALQFKIWGMDPFGYHLTSYLLHILNALLAWYLVFRLEKSGTIATLAVLLFALHPLRVEPVAWATAQKDLLFSFFLLLSVHSWLTYRDGDSRLHYCLSFLFFFLSLLSKGMAVVLPIILILFEIRRDQPLKQMIRLDMVPFFISSIFFSRIVAASVGITPHGDSFYYFLIGCHAFQYYLIKTFIPVDLSALVPFPAAGFDGLGMAFWVSPVTIAGVVISLFLLARRNREIGFWGLFYLVNTLPFLQFVPFGGSGIAADRFTYLPGIGIGVLAAGLFFRAMNFEGKRFKTLVFGAFVFLIATLSILSWNRCQVWSDSITLWTDVMVKYPEDPSAIALSNRGNALCNAGKYDAALIDLQKAIRLNPRNSSTWFSLGVVRLEKKQFKLAIEALETAISLNPGNSEIHSVLGGAWFREGNNEKALRSFENARKINPEDPQVLFCIGSVFSSMDRTKEAVEMFDQALKIQPDNVTFKLSRDQVLEKHGNNGSER